MQLNISASDQVLARYGNQLATLGERQARTALSRALNHEGDKGRTQVKRAFVKPICSRCHHHGSHVGHRPGLDDDLRAGLFGFRCLTLLAASTLTHLRLRRQL